MGKWPRLDKIEMIDGPIDKRSYERQIKKLQDRLLDLQIHDLRSGGRALICLDGWDAAGKGGMIERLIAGLEPKSVQVWRIGAPTPEDQGHHYLWRFWNRLPAPGNWAIFDRTWYGRVLVERIEGFCEKSAWERAYRAYKTLYDQQGRILDKLPPHIRGELIAGLVQSAQRTAMKNATVLRDGSSVEEP